MRLVFSSLDPSPGFQSVRRLCLLEKNIDNCVKERGLAQLFGEDNNYSGTDNNRDTKLVYLRSFVVVNLFPGQKPQPG